jgi:hypothetical protein
VISDITFCDYQIFWVQDEQTCSLGVELFIDNLVLVYFFFFWFKIKVGDVLLDVLE